MKHVLLMLIMLTTFSLVSLKAQVFSEGFEATVGMTSSSTGIGAWGINSRLFTEGSKSDSVIVTQGDTTYLTVTTSFSTIGKYAVYLNFDHICKIELYDNAYIEVSNNNGTTWTRLQGVDYLGTGQFGTIGDRFCEASYSSIWGVNSATPEQSWWQSETFDLSTIAANAADVTIRFVIVDGNNTGAAGRNGWFLDNIVVTASVSELVPPSITLNSPIIQDTVYSNAPIDISASISDASGVDTALCIIHIMPEDYMDTVAMVYDPTTVDTFSCQIPFYGFGRTTNYYVIAWDQAFARNVDSTNTKTYIAKNKPLYTEGFENGIPATWVQIASDDFDWTLKSGTTTSSGTGPSSAYEGINYIYTESSSPNSPSKVAIIESAVYSNAKSVSFRYHMYGVTTGVLYIDVFYNGAWVLDVYSLNGEQQTSNADAWLLANVDVSAYTSVNFKFRFRGITSSSFTSDMAVDDIVVQVNSKLNNDIGIASIINPNSGVLIGNNFDIKVDLANYGIDTITSAQVNWSFDGVAQTPYIFGTPADSIFPISLSDTIVLGTKIGTSGTHNIVAWTILPNGSFDSDLMNDTAKYSFYGCSSLLAGSYTIGGTGAEFATFTDAVLALNQCGISAPVVFNVSSGVYNEHIIINDVAGSSATNTIIFQSTALDSSSTILSYDAIGANDNYVVKLNGTSNIVFKNLSFVALDSTYARVFELTNNAYNLTFINNIISTVPSTEDDDNMALILATDTLGNNINISNNALLNSALAIRLQAGDINATNWNVSNNIINGHFAKAIELIGSYSANVMNNQIYADTASQVVGYVGILLSNSSGSPIVTKNMISTSETKIASGIVITDCVFDTINYALIANNIVNLSVNSISSTLSAGVLNYSSSNVNIYNNSLHFEGNQENSTNIILYANIAGTSMNINIVNNNLTNNADGYLFYVNNVDTSLWTVNNNNLYKFAGSNAFAHINSTINDFATWVTKSGAVNSTNINPFFNSTTGLHINNNSLNNTGIVLATVTDDINGVVRNVNTPDISAYEFDAQPWDITAIEVLAPLNGCGLTTTENVIVKFKNIGSSAINGGFNASYQLLGSATVVTEAVTTAIAAGDTIEFTFATKVDLDVSTFGIDSVYVITAWGNLTGDLVLVNDTTSAEVLSGFVPDDVYVADNTTTYGQSVTVSSIGMNPYWWASDTASVELWNDSLFTTPILYDTTTYWVSDRAGSGSMNVQMGNGTNVNSASGYPTPYANWFWGNKEQYLFLASELNAMGIIGGPITALQFNIITVNALPILNNYEIFIGTTASTALSVWEYGLTSVYTNSAYQGVAGWNLHEFNTPFVWDGITNLVVEICSNNSGYISNGNASVENSVTQFDATISTHSDNVTVCSAPNAGTTYSSRPNIKFSVIGQGCFSTNRTSFDIVVAIPAIDASISAINSPMDTVLDKTDLPLSVEIYNYGTSTLTSLDIIYSLNTIIQDTFSWTGSIAHQNTLSLIIDTINVPGGIYEVIAWSNNPNNIADIINSNDTVSAIFTAQLHGNYTIGADPTYDYPNLTTAVDALIDGGVVGACIFNIDTGTYTGQVSIPEINGVSATNNIIFQSMSGDSTTTILDNNSTITTENYVIKLDGADYFTFQNLTIKSSGSSNYQGVIEIGNGSTHNNFYNNIIQSSQSTSSNARCIYSSGANDNYTQIINNHIKDGYNAVYMTGASSSNTNNEEGTIINDNLIEGFSYYGIYAYYQDSIIIKGNTIIDGTTSNIIYPLYAYYCNEGFDISNNILDLSPNSYCNGLRIYYSVGNANERGLLSNNMISITSGGSTSTNNGLYIYNSQFVDVYHNSVNITAGGPNSRAAHIYVSNVASDVNFVNNILRDSIGYTLYLSNSAGINQMDYNSHYSTSVGMAYDGSDKANLSALQTSSGKEVHSVFGEQMFNSNTDLHLSSTNLSGYATPKSLVTKDIDGKLRNTISPTIGAHETDLVSIDMATQEILLVPNTTGEFNSYPVMAVIRNNGTDTIFAYQVNYTVNGGTSVVNAFTDTLAPYTIDTISLTPFISPAGASIICLTGVTTGDGNIYNNDVCHNFFGVPQKDAYVLSVDPIEGGCSLSTDTVTMWIKNIGLDTINGPSQSGTITVSFKNDNVATATVTTENFTTQIIPGDSVSYEFTALVDLANTTQIDSLYTVTAWITYPGDNVLYNDTAFTDVVSIHIPMNPVFTTPITIEYATAPLLSATASDSIYWFNYDTSSVEFYIGSNYQSNLFFASDTMYLETNTGGGVFKLTETVQYKTGTGATSPYPAHLPSGDFDGVEISNLGVSPGDLEGYQINVSFSSTSYSYTFPANTIINGGDVALAIYGGSLTVGPQPNNVFNLGTATTSSSVAATYWLVAPDGTIVDAFSANGGIFPSGSGVTVDDFNGSLAGGSSKPGAIRMVSDNNISSDWSNIIAGLASFGTFNTVLPQEGGAGCTSSRIPLVINVNPQQANDLHASVIIEPISMLNLNSTEDVKVRIINFGTASQSNFGIGYQLNNNTPVNATVSSTILSGDSLIYTFSQNVDLSVVDSTYMLKAYTDLTNDQNRLNDTVVASVTNMLPDYCTSSANSSLYIDITTVTMGTWSHTDNTPGQLYNDYSNSVAPIYIYASQSYNMDIVATTTGTIALSYAKVFIDFNRDGDFEDAGEMVLGNGFTPPATLSGIISIPHNVLLGPTRMRVVLVRGGTASSVQPCGTYSYGETQDYTVYVMDPIPNDAGVEMFVGLSNLTSASSLPITARIRNYGTDPISSVDISYYINNGNTNTVTYNTATIAPGDSVDVLLGTLLIADGMNEICAFTTLAGDTNTFNDSLCYNVFREAVVNLTYCDDFEGTDLWMPDTLLNQWERGIPTMTNINMAHSPTNVWAIDLDGTYQNNRSQLLYSPKFVITNIDSALLTFWHYYDNQLGSDGGYIQYSINDGAWVALGYVSDPRATNWYNDGTGGTNKFSGNSNAWVESTFNFDFTTGEFNNTDILQIRFNFFSNASGNSGDGWAIDDLCFELPLMPNDIGVVAVTNPISTAQIGSPITVTVDIANFGSATQTSFDVWYQIGNDPIVTETFAPTGGLASFDTLSYTFTVQSIAPSTNFIVCTGTSLASDIYPQNDDDCSDFIVVTAANIDGGITAIGKIQDWGGIGETSYLSPVVVKAEVKNFGITTLTSFDIEYSIDNGTNWTTEAWTGSLASNDVDTFIFATTYNSPPGNYSLCIRTVVPNDAYIANDQKCDPYIGTGINDASGIIFEVAQNEPNPAVGNVRINYIVPSNGDINFELRNTLGQMIYSVEKASFTGKNIIEIDADKLANGVYYYSVIFDGQRITRKMIVNQ